MKGIQNIGRVNLERESESAKVYLMKILFINLYFLFECEETNEYIRLFKSYASYANYLQFLLANRNKLSNLF